MYAILLTIHVIVALMLIGLVLIQQGKGSQTGASFGSGASTTVFGSQGSGGFLSRFTGFLAAAFFVISLMLAYILNKEARQAHSIAVPVNVEAPASSKPVIPAD